jgi:hypothetical protein
MHPRKRRGRWPTVRFVARSGACFAPFDARSLVLASLVMTLQISFANGASFSRESPARCNSSTSTTMKGPADPENVGVIQKRRPTCR